MKTRLWWLLVPVVLAGCGTPQTAEQKTADDEYILVHVTGSNVPKRVKKSDLVKGTVAKDVDTQLADKDQFARQMRPGRQLDSSK